MITLPENYKEIKQKITEIYSYLLNIINSPNERIKEIITKLENLWNVNKMNSNIDIFNNIYKLRVNYFK